MPHDNWSKDLPERKHDRCEGINHYSTAILNYHSSAFSTTASLTFFLGCSFILFLFLGNFPASSVHVPQSSYCIISPKNPFLVSCPLHVLFVSSPSI